MRGRSACARAERAARKSAAYPWAAARTRVTPVAAAPLVALTLTTPSALAQESDVEEIVVTGSRIARPDFESASPIVSVTEDFFRRSGSGTVESQLNTLPQLVPSFTSTSNNPSNGGQGNLDLSVRPRRSCWSTASG